MSNPEQTTGAEPGDGTGGFSECVKEDKTAGEALVAFAFLGTVV